MWWAILALGGLVGVGAWWRTRPRQPRSRADAGETLYLQIDGELVVAQGTWNVALDEHAARLEVEVPTQAGLRGPLCLSIRRSALEDTLEGSLGGRTLRFGGEVEPVELIVSTGAEPPLEVPGVQITVLDPLRAPFVREWRLIVAVPEGDVLAEAFGDTAAVELLAVPWTLEGATRFARKTLLERGWAAAVESPSPGVLAVEYPDGTEAQLQLHNIFPTIRDADPTEGQRRLLAHLESTVDGLKAREHTARDQLMVRVYAGPAPFTLTLPGHEPVVFASVPLASDLTAVYVQDTPTSMRPLRDAEVGALEADPSAQLALARSNLLASLPEIRIVGSGPVYMVTAGGDYENALVLLPELWDVLEPMLDGPPLVAIPARDLLFVTGDVGRASVEVLAGLAQGTDELSYPISSGVYRVVDRGAGLERIA